MPRPFVEEDVIDVVALTRSVGFGHLVTNVHGELDSTPMPFLIDDDATTLRGHLARANPLLSGLPSAALMIVPVTDAYISPGLYPTKQETGRVVPTWNYEIVHLRGELRAHDDVWTLALVRELSDHFEATMARPWSVDDAPDDYVAKLLGGIVGVSLTIERFDAKRKLSQNKGAADVQGAADGLDALGDERGRRVADAMRAEHPG